MINKIRQTRLIPVLCRKEEFMSVRIRSRKTLYLCLAVVCTAIIVFAVSCSLNPHGNSGSGRGFLPFAGAMTVSGGGYNYGEALQKAIMFYEFQRSGKITPSLTNGRMNWRGDSDLLDGSDNGIDLTGGWHDAGDHIKFNLPMSYSVSMLSWAIYEYGASIKTSGQYDALTNNIKWVTDYLLKCSAGTGILLPGWKRRKRPFLVGALARLTLR